MNNWIGGWIHSLMRDRIKRCYMDRYGIHFQDRQHNYHFFWNADRSGVKI